MSKPLVSIITPTFNSNRFIGETINSVLNQTYTNWEMLITDDCSTDETFRLLEKYAAKDNRIKVFKLNKNSGAAFARNNSLLNTTGRFIAFCDSDDLWYPHKLEVQIKFMQTKNIAFSFSSYQIIDNKGSFLNKIISVPEVLEYKDYLKNTIIGCLTVIIDKSKTGYFEMPNIRSSHDMALWLLIMKRGFKAYGINQVLASYRLVSTSNTSNKWKAAKDVWKVYRQIEKINSIQSCYYFMYYSLNAFKKRL